MNCKFFQRAQYRDPETGYVYGIERDEAEKYWTVCYDTPSGVHRLIHAGGIFGVHKSPATMQKDLDDWADKTGKVFVAKKLEMYDWRSGLTVDEIYNRNRMIAEMQNRRASYGSMAQAIGVDRHSISEWIRRHKAAIDKIAQEM